MKVKAKEEKDDGHGRNSSTIFLLAAKVMCFPGVIKAKQMTLTKDKDSHNWNPKISVNPSSILLPFWRNKPDMPYLCRRGLSGLKRKVLPFALCSKRPMKKTLNL